MDRLVKINRDELIKEMQAEFLTTMHAVAEAVNAAKDGYLINGSEEACREALGEFRRKVYEKALQMRIAATEKSVAFSPDGSNSSGSRKP